jgi:hypothetical protein
MQPMLKDLAIMFRLWHFPGGKVRKAFDTHPDLVLMDIVLKGR